MPIVTVVGAASTVLAVSLDGTINLQLAQQFAAVVNGASAGGTLFATNLGGAVPPVPRGDLGEAVVLSAGSVETLPAGYATAIEVAAGPTTISAGANTSPISVLAGTGGLTFNAGPGQMSRPPDPPLPVRARAGPPTTWSVPVTSTTRSAPAPPTPMSSPALAPASSRWATASITLSHTDAT